MNDQSYSINRRNFLSRMGKVSVAAALPWEALTLNAQSNQVAAATPGLARGKNRLQTFEYRGVKLLPGMFRTPVENTRELYFNLSNDDILKGFRRQAGLPSPGNDLKGWARNTCDATFGQWLSGMARLSCALDDSAMRNKAIALAEGWKETIGSDGRCRMGTYQWEKMSCGLVDMALYAGYDPNLTLLEKITNWASRRFDRSRSPATMSDRDGRRPKGTLEWYTLTENMFRAYQLTGNETFRNFGELWFYNSYWNKFENSAAPAGVNFLHSYSHVNTFCGAAMAYAVTGESRYLKILQNGCDYVTNTQAYVTGGYGPGEWSVPADGSLGSALEIRTDTAEIPCGSWAGFKLSRYLLGFTGNARHTDWLETLLYNGIGAALPVQSDGRSFYYADYRLGMATKLYHWDEWPCCSGTYIQTVADYHNVIYLKDEKGLFVNLFVPSEVNWTQGGQEITVRQETKFPESDDVNFQVQTAQPVNFAFRIRVPSWSGAVALKLNEADLPFQTDAEGWAVVARTWNPNDKLQLKLSSSLRLAPVDPQHPRRAAVKFGPVLLAQEARFTYPLALSGDNPADKLQRETDDLHFRVSGPGGGGQSPGGFKPYYQVPERLPYRVYFDLDNPRFL
jgi:hypothetical protein